MLMSKANRHAQSKDPYSLTRAPARNASGEFSPLANSNLTAQRPTSAPFDDSPSRHLAQLISLARPFASGSVKDAQRLGNIRAPGPFPKIVLGTQG